MTTGQDFLRSLLEGADQTKLAAFLKTIKPEAPPETSFEKKHRAERSNSPVKTYTTVIKKFTCLACDSHFLVTCQMGKGEQTFCISETGNVKVLTVSGKPGELILISSTSKCAYCANVAKTWTREKLEEKWIALVQTSTFKEIVKHKNSLLEKGE